MTDEREMRQTLAGALVERAKTDDRIVVIEADLMSCHATKVFKQDAFSVFKRGNFCVSVGADYIGSKRYFTD